MGDADSGASASEFICALFAGAACGSGTGPEVGAADPCIGVEPYAHVYRLRAAEATAAAELEQAMAVLERRLWGAGSCALVVELVADGTMTVQVVSRVAEGPLSATSLEPGVVAFYPVLDAGTPVGPGIAVLPGTAGEPFTVRWESVLPPDPVASAEALVRADTGWWVVHIVLTPLATEAFAEATAAAVGEALAIAVDDRILMAPRIMEPILDGSLHLSGNFAQAEAEQLAAVLDSGALPTRFELLSIEQVPMPAAAAQ